MNWEKVTIICPTYNAGVLFNNWIESILTQSVDKFNVLIIDSSSSDDTVKKCKQAGFKVEIISKDEFNHAGTRNQAAQIAKKRFGSEYLIFLTQDAILNDSHALAGILRPFDDPEVVAVCGRQLPHLDADPIARHAREFNYSIVSRKNSKNDIAQLGLKTAYMSNSFAAYRFDAYQKCGGFPEGLIFGEDMYLSAKMILAGHCTYYAGKASVRHSHNYSLIEEFRRYFDIGVFHSSQTFLLENFGKPSGEGVRFALSEVRSCLKKGRFYWAVNSIFRTGLKFFGYKFGLMHSKIPRNVCLKLSMDRNYWR